MSLSKEIFLINPDDQITVNDQAGSVTFPWTLNWRRGDPVRFLFIDQMPLDQEIDFSDFMGLIRVRPSGKIAAPVVQTWPGQFATMPVAAV